MRLLGWYSLKNTYFDRKYHTTKDLIRRELDEIFHDIFDDSEILSISASSLRLR